MEIGLITHGLDTESVKSAILRLNCLSSEFSYQTAKLLSACKNLDTSIKIPETIDSCERNVLVHVLSWPKKRIVLVRGILGKDHPTNVHRYSENYVIASIDSPEAETPRLLASRIFHASIISFGINLIESKPPSHLRFIDSPHLPEQLRREWIVLFASSQPSGHVFMTHGIRTTGEWIRRAESMFRGIGYTTNKKKFGYLRLFEFLFGRVIIDKLSLDLLTEICTDYKAIHATGREYNIICHSYGTLLLGRALSLAKQLGIQLNINTIILNGSILPTYFPWKTFLSSPLQEGSVVVQKVYNMRAQNDIWPLIGSWWRSDYGNAGVYGFESTPEGIREYILPNKNHSSMLSDEIINDYWLKLICGTEPTQNHLESEQSFLPRAIALILRLRVYLFLLILILIYYKTQ